jgi:release factor glutamine methyltransferase
MSPPRGFLILNRVAHPYAVNVTVLEVIQRSTEFLTRRGVDSPRLHAELLSAHVLGMARMQLYLNFERVLSVQEQDRLRELIKRRGDREPLQHIVGSTSFCGLELQVNRSALVPRPETELLAEQGWLFLNQGTQRRLAGVEARFGEQTANTRGPAALDFGTGTGCLAIALSKHCPDARVVALDIEPAAIELARRNADQLQVSESIEFLLSDGFTALKPGTSFDLIVANPPYIPTAEIEGLDPEVRQFDPRRALDGGADGLMHYRQLATQAGAFLNPDGRLMVEFGDGQEVSLAELFKSEKWIVEQILNDYTQRPRILIARK